MRESAKTILAAIFLLAAIASSLGWAGGPNDWPDWLTLLLKYGCLAISVTALIILLKIHFRKDEVPDFLFGRVGEYFNRGGLGFSAVPTAENGTAILEIHYQNQFANPCIGQVALRPARGFFLGRAAIEPIAVQIECGPAAFGVVRVPIGVPKELQGKTQSFEVGASVEYPGGHGRRVRFRDGIFLRANSQFGNAFTKGLTVLGAMSGTIVWTRPAKIRMTLPDHVREVINDSSEPSVQTLWQLGDPISSLAGV